jgi:hypothetical protein
MLFYILYFSTNVTFIYYITCLLTAIILTPSDSSTVYVYIQTVHRTTQLDRIPTTGYTQ